MKYGYVLSGGGARGIAHLGIIKFLEENNIYPSAISGTSAGAIIGAFYAHGYRAEEILNIIADIKLYKVLRPAFNLDGLITLEKTFGFFSRFMPENSFESLKIPLHIAAVHVKSGKIRFFSSGKLIPAILASSAIPVIFNPVEIDGEVYIDGGILNNLPVEPLTGGYDKIIGMHCNPVDDKFTHRKMRNILERTFLLSTGTNVAQRKPQCDYFFEPQELFRFGAFDFARAKEIFRTGYDYAKSKIPLFAENNTDP